MKDAVLDRPLLKRSDRTVAADSFRSLLRRRDHDRYVVLIDLVVQVPDRNADQIIQLSRYGIHVIRKLLEFLVLNGRWTCQCSLLRTGRQRAVQFVE